MGNKEIIFRPTVKQLKADIKHELWVALSYFFPCVTALILLGSLNIALCLSPLLFLVPYLRYLKYKRTLEQRFIKIEDEQLIQEVPNIHELLKKWEFKGYCRAFLNGRNLGFGSGLLK